MYQLRVDSYPKLLVTKHPTYSYLATLENFIKWLTSLFIDASITKHFLNSNDNGAKSTLSLGVIFKQDPHKRMHLKQSIYYQYTSVHCHYKARKFFSYACFLPAATLE